MLCWASTQLLHTKMPGAQLPRLLPEVIRESHWSHPPNSSSAQLIIHFNNSFGSITGSSIIIRVYVLLVSRKNFFTLPLTCVMTNTLFDDYCKNFVKSDYKLWNTRVGKMWFLREIVLQIKMQNVLFNLKRVFFREIINLKSKH